MNPKGKVALITGGAVRVGQAISLGLAGAGAHIVVHYNSSASAAGETVAAAQKLGVEALAVQADLSDPTATAKVIQTVQERFGRVDILVHSASPFVQGSLFDVTLETWHKLQAVSVESFLLLVQGLAPGMVQNGVGAIVAVLDRGVLDPWPGFLAHSVGKSALWALARSLAVELAPHVRVNGVVSGPVLPAPGATQEQEEKIARATLLGHWGAPHDVVEAILYLVRADYVTGEALVVDGGARWAHRRPA